MLAYREAAIHKMDGFHSQNVGSKLRTCPRTGPSMSRHDCGVRIALIHDCGEQYELRQTVANIRLDIGRCWRFFMFSVGPESYARPIRYVFAFCLHLSKTCASGRDAGCKTSCSDCGGACSSSKRHGLEAFRQSPSWPTQFPD